MQLFRLLVLVSGLLSIAPSEPNSQLFGSSMVWISDSDQAGKGRLVFVDASPQRVPRHELISLNLSTGAHRTIGSVKLRASSASSALALVHLPGKSEQLLAVATLTLDGKLTNAQIRIFDPVAGTLISEVDLATDVGLSAASQVYCLGNIDGLEGDEVLVKSVFDWGHVQSPEQFRLIALADGRVVREIHAGDVIPVSDLDNDGVKEYVVVNGEVYEVHSGKSGKSLFGLHLAASTKEHKEREDTQIAYSFFELGDLSLDGKRDFLCAQSSQTTRGDQTLAETYPVCMARLQALSGEDGSVLWTADAQVGSEWYVVNAIVLKDQNSDGVDDILAVYSGYPRGDDSHWRVHSGVDGSRIGGGPLKPEAFMAMTWGYAVTAVADQDGDGIIDFAISRATHRVSGIAGLIAVYSSKGGLIKSFGAKDISGAQD